ncbi:MAG: Dolichyl-phosphate-mannose-protein mannosyltransferase [Verrucomicrobia bacterium]|nr:Dolichyl-phosphate-mannose-protein mannosyltransferase [Verrucomicrobiota bacterium]
MITAPLFSRTTRLGLIALSLGGFCLGLRGIQRYGYIGQDYTAHHDAIVRFTESYGYHFTDPPGYSWLGHLIYRHLSPVHYLETFALLCLVLNTAALWLLYRLVWQSVKLEPLRWAAAALATFIPVRVIHSIVIAADALTLPIFILVVWFTLQLRENPRRVFAWIALNASFSIGMVIKYTFAGLLAPLLLVALSTMIQRVAPHARIRWLALMGVTLALPVALMVYQYRESSKVHGAITHVQWLPPGAPSVMRWQDMLVGQPSDAELFEAPDYFGDQLYEYRKFSYPGLVFISAVTDPLNLFQDPPPEISTAWDQRYHEGFFRGRSAGDDLLQSRATFLSFPLFVLAIAGTLVCGVLALAALLRRNSTLPDAVVVLTALAVGYFSPIFLGLPRIADPYGEGFWMARLILPAIVVFFTLGFVLLDLSIRRYASHGAWQKLFASGVLAWTALTCITYIGFLA